MYKRKCKMYKFNVKETPYLCRANINEIKRIARHLQSVGCWAARTVAFSRKAFRAISVSSNIVLILLHRYRFCNGKYGWWWPGDCRQYRFSGISQYRIIKWGQVLTGHFLRGVSQPFTDDRHGEQFVLADGRPWMSCYVRCDIFPDTCKFRKSFESPVLGTHGCFIQSSSVIFSFSHNGEQVFRTFWLLCKALDYLLHAFIHRNLYLPACFLR